MKNRLIICFLLVLSFLSCSKDDATEDPISISPIAENYLNELLDIMEVNSINRYKIDWSDFRTKVFGKAKSAQTIQDTYPAIREALILLGDNHSSYYNADEIINATEFIFVGTLECDFQNIVNPSLPENIGYVKINSFTGASNSAAGISFAQQIQDQIINQDNLDIIGWIVDLRSNGGGNMWPMVAGIGPILGEGTAGYFIDPDDNQTSWGFLNGSSVINGTTVTELSNSYELAVPNPKVAVLLDKGVVSSGEVMAISFIGRENTKSFGTSTCGASTGNDSFILSDNSTLILTTVYLADRNKNLYGIPIEPDMFSSNENIIQDALNWIEN